MSDTALNLASNKSYDLLASHWAVAGDTYPGGPTEVSSFTIEDRIQVSAEAGFVGMGLLHADLLAIEERIGLSRLGKLLDAAGMRHIEVECLINWFADGDVRAASDRQRADLLRAAEALGARHIKVNGDLEGRQWPADRLADEFARLCAQADDVGAMVAIEFIPFSGIRDIAAARAIVESAGAANGKLLIDTWHVARAHTPYEEVAALPADLIAHVEIDDAPADPVGGPWVDTVHHRKLPGEGDLDVPEFLRAIAATGYDGPVGVEILSSIHRQLPLQDAARATHASAERVFQAAGLSITSPREPSPAQNER